MTKEKLLSSTQALRKKEKRKKKERRRNKLIRCISVIWRGAIFSAHNLAMWLTRQMDPAKLNGLSQAEYKYKSRVRSLEGAINSSSC